MKNIFWIIGAGRFGQIALNRLSAVKKDAAFVLVDTHPPDLPLEQYSATFLEADGITWLNRRLTSENAPDWIIPAVPVHLAAMWCLSRLREDGIRRIPLPPDSEHRLPHPVRGESGDLYISHADFLCPDDCPEPADFCTVTRKKRPPNLFEILAEFRVPGFSSRVVRSHQLAPGLGGYRPEILFQLLEDVRNAPDRCLISTACRCHGVMTALARADA